MCLRQRRGFGARGECCEVIKVDLLCRAPARDKNSLWARKEGSWDSQKDYLQLESWDFSWTKSLLTCSSYEQPLIKSWSFMSCGIRWVLAHQERASLDSCWAPGGTPRLKASLSVDSSGSTGRVPASYPGLVTRRNLWIHACCAADVKEWWDRNDDCRSVWLLVRLLVNFMFYVLP